MFMSMLIAFSVSFVDLSPAANTAPTPCASCFGFCDYDGECHTSISQCQNAERGGSPSGIYCSRCCAQFAPDIFSTARKNCQKTCPPSTNNPTNPDDPIIGPGDLVPQ